MFIKSTKRLYFYKAFDTVPHNEPLLKLWSGGITGNLCSWFHSNLSFCQQCVSVNGCLSSVLHIKSGVPQGNILGPLLFLIYINDISKSVNHSTELKFADDTKCFKSINTQMNSTYLQQDLNSLFQWSINNHLSTLVSVLYYNVCSHLT